MSMTLEQIQLFFLFGCVFALFLWGRFRYDLVAFSALLVAVVLGLIPAGEAFLGFGNPATVIVALVLIVSAGLVRSGAVALITRSLIRADRAVPAHIVAMGGIGSLLSAFMNNVAALALLMPVDVQTARKSGRPPSRTLMALSFATILGGMITLIGTPPNILIASIRADQLGAPFAMFDFAPVGGVTALVGLVFIALIGWRLVPQREESQHARDSVEAYVVELTVPEDSRHIGQRLVELEPMADEADAAILGLIRDGKRRYGTQRNTLLRAGDTIVIEATPEALDELRIAAKLDYAEKEREERVTAEGAGTTLIEAVVTDRSRLIGKTAQSVGLSWRQRTILMGISRHGKLLRQRIRQTPIRSGDILLLLTPQDRADDVTSWLGVLPLADRGVPNTDTSKVWIAIALFAGAVLAAALGLIDLPVALGVVVVGYVLTGILPISDIYDHVQWPIVILLGSMIPLGAALDSAGGTELIADGLLSLTQSAPAWVALLMLMVVTMTLSDVLNNAATAIVAAPVGISMAERLGVSPDPFLMAVAVAASCAFLTPIGHQNNTLVMGPGGYRFSDYWRMGLPLEVLVIATSIPAILVFWPLQ